MYDVQPLEPRSLLASNGLDPNFGTNGMVSLPTSLRVDPSPAVLAQSNGIFIGANTGSSFGVTKLRDNGQVDTDWGTNGSTSLGFKPSQFIYDTRRNGLYAIGVTEAGDQITLSVSRLDAGGRRLDTFGTNGTFTYSLENSTQLFSQLAVNAVVIESDGQLVLGLEQRVRPAPADGEIYPIYQTRESLLLMRLTTTGRYDPTFGQNGVVTVTTGSQTDSNSESGYSSEIDNVDLASLVPRSDGTYAAVFSRDKAFESGSNGGNYSNIDGDFSVTVRRVSTLGQIDAKRDRTYSISRTRVDGYNRHFDPLLVSGRNLGDGDIGITVIGANTINGVLSRPMVVNIAPGGQTSSGVLAGGFRPNRIVQNAMNQLFLFGGGKIAKLTNLQPDSRWGGNGIVTYPGASQFVPDADGRLVGVGGSPTVATRLNGMGSGSMVVGDASLVDNEIVVLGTGENDTIDVNTIPATQTTPERIRVVLDGKVFGFRYRSGVTTLHIDAGGGDDRINISGIRCTANIAAGRGDDTVNAGDNLGGRINFALGAGRDFLILGAGERPRTLLGGDGFDTLNAVQATALGAEEFETYVSRPGRG